jgi:MOSC domain-containing protein YiiM
LERDRLTRGVGTLLSANVGMPKDVPWQGKTVFTGVFKDPVSGARRVAKLNVDGDGQGDLAGHAGEQRAVFVYQHDSYRHWEKELGRDDFVYGQFGENFTVQGLPDDEVCIGDHYQIGGAIFEVTQPRVTCYRVGIRMKDLRIPALLVSHRRPGFYFRVLQEGEVEAGAEIVKLAPGPEQMTVAEVSALLYLPSHPRQQLLRALRIPALSAGWQESFRALLGGEAGGGNTGLVATSPPPAWPGFRRLTVTAIEQESDSVVSIRFEDPEGTPLPAARPGQYLTLRIQPEADKTSLLRNYSLCGPPDAGYYRIAVKREQHGAASGYLSRSAWLSSASGMLRTPVLARGVHRGECSQGRFDRLGGSEATHLRKPCTDDLHAGGKAVGEPGGHHGRGKTEQVGGQDRAHEVEHGHRPIGVCDVEPVFERQLGPYG